MTDTPPTAPDTTPQTVPIASIGPVQLQNLLVNSIFKTISHQMPPDTLTAIAAAARAYAELRATGEMEEQIKTLQADMKLMAMRSPAQRNA